MGALSAWYPRCQRHLCVPGGHHAAAGVDGRGAGRDLGAHRRRQTYLQADLRREWCRPRNRHRELVYEMVRKNLIAPGVTPANLSKATLVRSFHPALSRRKNPDGERWPIRTMSETRRRCGKGLIPSRYLFETYPNETFPRLAYAMDWNVRTCFPRTPHGWLPVVPPDAWPLPGRLAIHTDGEQVLLDGVPTDGSRQRRRLWPTSFPTARRRFRSRPPALV